MTIPFYGYPGSLTFQYTSSIPIHYPKVSTPALILVSLAIKEYSLVSRSIEHYSKESVSSFKGYSSRAPDLKTRLTCDITCTRGSRLTRLRFTRFAVRSTSTRSAFSNLRLLCPRHSNQSPGRSFLDGVSRENEISLAVKA